MIQGPRFLPAVAGGNGPGPVRPPIRWRPIYGKDADDLSLVAERLCSGCVMIGKDAVRRVGIERCQSRIEAESRRAIGTEDSVRLAHIDVDVRVVLRWGHADALELRHPDADFRDTAVVPELRIAVAGHQLKPL